MIRKAVLLKYNTYTRSLSGSPALLLIAVAMLFIPSLVLAQTENSPSNFMAISNGHAVPTIQSTDEYRSNAEVITWAADTAHNTMMFDFVDYPYRFLQSSSRFTNKGWDSFNIAIKNLGLIEAIKNRKLVVSLIIGAAPEIVYAGVTDGRYTWDLRFPVAIKLESAAESPQHTLAILMLRIVRVSPVESPEGIKIEQWIMDTNKAEKTK